MIKGRYFDSVNEYLDYCELKEKEKREAKDRFWSKVGTMFLCAITGAGIASLFILAAIGFAVLF